MSDGALAALVLANSGLEEVDFSATMAGNGVLEALTASCLGLRSLRLNHCPEVTVEVCHLLPPSALTIQSLTALLQACDSLELLSLFGSRLSHSQLQRLCSLKPSVRVMRDN
jgi:hypothetical protein